MPNRNPTRGGGGGDISHCHLRENILKGKEKKGENVRKREERKRKEEVRKGKEKRKWEVKG